MNTTPWSRLVTVVQWGKWVLAAMALNAADDLIEGVFWTAAGLLLLAVIADRLRTRRLERRWADHCQDIADQWAAKPTATVTPLPQREQRRAA